jgi:hypothetical protein
MVVTTYRPLGARGPPVDKHNYSISCAACKTSEATVQWNTLELGEHLTRSPESVRKLCPDPSRRHSAPASRSDKGTPRTQHWA